MAVIPETRLRRAITSVPQNQVVYLEPGALRVDAAGNGFLDPSYRSVLPEFARRFNLDLYLQVRTTPQGPIVSLPEDGFWETEDDLDTTGLVPVFEFAGRQITGR